MRRIKFLSFLPSFWQIWCSGFDAQFLENIYNICIQISALGIHLYQYNNTKCTNYASHKDSVKFYEEIINAQIFPIQGQILDSKACQKRGPFWESIFLRYLGLSIPKIQKVLCSDTLLNELYNKNIILYLIE